ncbi:hypothetical protein ACN28C_02990 [Plantactinospora sp. WMMC1484]|uniref:hypothetical protein n=1 Tax=Plantactinospora sp. WMMC1484 TaxID=3404122 RepID=UPI003BF4B91C
MSPKKNPKVNKAALAKATGERQPKTIVRPQGNDRKLIFSFQYVDRGYDGLWSWPRSDSGDAYEILTFLCEASQCTWGELMAQMTGQSHNRKKKHHAYPIKNVCAAAQARIVELRLDEVFEELFRFRISGERRLWGFRAEDVFHVLWWDAHHQVYPTDRN